MPADPPAAPTRDPVALATLLAAFALALATRLYNLAAPFGYGYDGWLGAMYGNAARNLARNGFAAMRFVATLDAGPVKFGDVQPHLHHPPLVWNLEALVLRVFGVSDVSEWSLRLLPSIAFLVALGLAYAIARRLSTPRIGALAALALAALPMTGVYGGLVNYEPFVLAAEAGTYLCWLRWRETGAARDLAATAALLAIGILFDWFGAFVGIPIALEALLARPRAARWPVTLLGCVAVATVAAVLVYYSVIYPGALAEIAHHAEYRAGASRTDMGGGSYGLVEWLGKQATSLRKGYTIPGLGLWIAGLGLASRSARPELRRAALHGALLACLGFLPLLTFPQAAFTHEFLSFSLGLSVAIGVALGLVTLTEVSPGARCVAIALGIAFLCTAQHATWVRLSGERHTDSAYRDLGHEIAAAVPFASGVVTPGQDGNVWWPVMFYADRSLTMGIDSEEKLANVRRVPPRASAPVRYVVFTPVLFQQHEAFARALIAAKVPAMQGQKILVFDLGP